MLRNCIILLLCAMGFLFCLAVRVVIRKQLGLSDGWAAVCSLPFNAAYGWVCYSLSRWRKT